VMAQRPETRLLRRRMCVGREVTQFVSTPHPVRATPWQLRPTHGRLWKLRGWPAAASARAAHRRAGTHAGPHGERA
jgi:hypothetical protein